MYRYLAPVLVLEVARTTRLQVAVVSSKSPPAVPLDCPYVTPPLVLTTPNVIGSGLDKAPGEASG